MCNLPFPLLCLHHCLHSKRWSYCQPCPREGMSPPHSLPRQGARSTEGNEEGSEPALPQPLTTGHCQEHQCKLGFLTYAVGDFQLHWLWLRKDMAHAGNLLPSPSPHVPCPPWRYKGKISFFFFTIIRGLIAKPELVFWIKTQFCSNRNCSLFSSQQKWFYPPLHHTYMNVKQK